MKDGLLASELCYGVWRALDGEAVDGFSEDPAQFDVFIGFDELLDGLLGLGPVECDDGDGVLRLFGNGRVD
ncbi:hypothetical protein [Neobacillus muris]|uniref:hypothetical protein n=1 Tax=Neobacillus muris TaxID=2941334 RepID=UPI0030B9D926